MEERHRNILINCHKALVKDLEPNKVFQHLIQERVLTDDDQERNIKLATRKDRSEEFLRILPTGGPCAYGEFVKALEKTQSFLACLLLREELSVAEAKCRDLESQLQEVSNRSCIKQPSGKKQNLGKKKKNNARGKLGIFPITVSNTTVTTRRTTRGLDKLEEFINKTARSGLELFPLTTDQNLKKYCRYLASTLKIKLLNKKEGSLKLTVHCRSLEILERLWEDYCSGHLDAVAEECLVTDEVKKETGVDATWLETTISEEDYLRCKKFLTEISGLNSSTDKETAEMEDIKFKNILFEFQEMLLENLDPEEVSHQLTEAGVLTPEDKDKIKEKQTRREKSEQLLMILATEGPTAYEEFVKALEKDHCFLACQLLKEEKENLLYEVRERKWLLKEGMDEKERAITAADENEKVKAQLEKEKERLLEEQKKKDEELKEVKGKLLAEKDKVRIFASENEKLETLCKELKYKLQEAKYAEPRKKVVTWEEIVRIMEDVESSWWELGTALELGKEKLRKVDNRKKSNSEKAMAVLEMWMNEGGSDATVGRLEDTLRKIGKGSIADKLLEPEEEIRDGDEREVEKLLEATRENISAESREKEGTMFASSPKDSLDDVFKELNIPLQEASSHDKKKTKQRRNKRKEL